MFWFRSYFTAEGLSEKGASRAVRSDDWTLREDLITGRYEKTQWLDVTRRPNNWTLREDLITGRYEVCAQFRLIPWTENSKSLWHHEIKMRICYSHQCSVAAACEKKVWLFWGHRREAVMIWVVFVQMNEFGPWVTFTSYIHQKYCEKSIRSKRSVFVIFIIDFGPL